MPKVNKNTKAKKSQKRVQASLATEQRKRPKDSKWKVKFAPPSLKTKPSDVKVNKKVTFSPTTLRSKPSDEVNKSSTIDILDDYEVIIEQPGPSNNEEPEVFQPDNIVQFTGGETIILLDPMSPDMKAELSDEEEVILVVRDIEEMPRDKALETPLHPKRRRVWQPQSPAAPVPSSPCSSPAGDGEVPSTSSAPQVEHAPRPSDASPSSAKKVPSPAAYSGCEPASTPSASPSVQHPRPSPRSRPRQSARDLINCGSEDDSEGSGDEEEEDPGLPTMTARALRKMMAVWGQEDGEVDKEDDADPEPAADVPLPEPLADPTLRATDQPWSLYDFKWRQFPDTPIAPESRREQFSQIDVGPTIPYVDPYDIFVAIWDRQFMEYIALESNRYAQQVVSHMIDSHNLGPQSRINNWTDTTADELYVYFGLILAMGVVVRSRMGEYWGSTLDVFCTPGFSAHMSFNRFVLLSKCLHFVNNEDVCQLALEGSEARLYKIKPLLSHLNKKFQDLYTLSQNIALDESLLLWKGSLDIGQLIPNKAASRGIKTYEICESQTGYLWRFEVHAYKKSTPSLPQSENPMEKSTPAIVLRLTQGLEHKGYTLWMDNFYNSPCLARRLKCLGFDCVGTLRTNRRFVPESLHNLTKQNMRRGQITGLTAGDIDVMVWRDCGRVAMISTYHGNGVQTVRGSTKPILIHDYNIMMGGVDKKDQMLAMYPVERKRTKVWYKKLFRRLLNVSVLNSFIIHRHNSPSSSRLTHRNFRISLVKSLLCRHSTPAPIARPQKQQTFDISHRPAFNPLGRTTRKRRICVVCKKTSAMFCVGCEKTVCLDPCFVLLHS